VPTVLKSGSLNLLEPSGPVQACNEIALPFTFILLILLLLLLLLLPPPIIITIMVVVVVVVIIMMMMVIIIIIIIIINWYKHVPKSVEIGQGRNVTILWNQQVQTNRTIPNNKPDIIIRDNEKRTCMLIDVAISEGRNVIKKEAEKILKYKDLTIEIQRMWNVKTKVIPVIIGATGTISKSFRKYVSNIPGNHKVKELQKTAILGTAHILRKVLT
jgi:hypothetical protein